MGQLLPNFNDIEPEEMEEPVPSTEDARYYSWHEITGELLHPRAQQEKEDETLPHLIHVMPEPDIELPSAPSGRPPFRKIEGISLLT